MFAKPFSFSIGLFTSTIHLRDQYFCLAGADTISRFNFLPIIISSQFSWMANDSSNHTCILFHVYNCHLEACSSCFSSPHGRGLRK